MCECAQPSSRIIYIIYTYIASGFAHSAHRHRARLHLYKRQNDQAASRKGVHQTPRRRRPRLTTHMFMHILSVFVVGFWHTKVAT